MESNENVGYLYCMSNPCMPGILKCGFTLDDVNERASQLFTTGVPLPFKIEIAKKINNPREKEKSVHTLLEKYYDRINKRREFFKVNVNDVLDIFNIIDGEYIDVTKIVYNENEIFFESKMTLNQLFKDSTLIRHKKYGFCEFGFYDKSKNKLFRCDENSNLLFKSGAFDIPDNENIFTSLDSFTSSNYRKNCPYKTDIIDTYGEVEYYNNSNSAFYFVKSII